MIATDIRLESLEGKPFEARKLDVRDKQAIDALAQEIGAVDVLFNCAGYVARRLDSRSERGRLGLRVRSSICRRRRPA